MAAIITQTGNEKLDPKQYSGKDLSLIGEFPIKSEFTPTTDTIEYYVYDINNRLISYTPEFNRFTILRDDPSMGQATNTISLNVEQNLTQKGYTQGTYQTVYNFFRNKLNSSFRERFFIKEISPTRTEIRLSSNTLDNSTLDILVSDFITERNNAEYFEDFFINFGENNQFVASNIILDDANPSKYTVLIKLYNPLPNNFTLNDTCWVCTEVADPKTFLIEFEKEEIVTDSRLFLQGPNFNIEIKDEISNATNYQTLNDLLNNTELTSSYNQLQNILDQKGVSINIDYGLDTVTFENFTHFSSAEQRVRNFYYKVGLIEEANNNISLIDGLSGTPDVSSSLSAYEQVITDTIKSFDGFESFMYYKSSSEGTNGTPWPKSNSTIPYTLQSTGSNDVLTWYDRMLTSASAYDQENSDNLIYSIPEYLRDDPVNAPYELFIEMMGQYFDQLYFYAEDITNKYNADNRLDFGVSKDIVADVLKSFGIKLYSNNFTSDDLYAALLGINAGGSLLPPTGSEVIETYITASNEAIPLNDVNKETYKRIYHNMPYLLKKKGTVEGVRALISLFGIPDTILRISEFGGKDKDNTNDWDYTQNIFNYSAYTSGSSTLDNIISSSWDIGTRWDSVATIPQNITFRFKPKNLPNSDTYHVLAHIQNNASPVFNHRLTLAYTGSGLSSGSYSGSIPSSSNEYAEINLWSNLTKLASVTAPFYDGNWWGVQVQRTNTSSPYTFSLRVANKIYDGKDGWKIGFTASQEISDTTALDGWGGGDVVYFPTSQSTAYNLPFVVGEDFTGFTGSYQEIRYYKGLISESTFHDFVMNPHSIEGENYSSSADDLVFRAPLGSDLNTNTGVLESIHPKVTGSLTTSSFDTGDSDYYVGSGITFDSNTEFIYQDQPAVGIKNRISDKIKFTTADTASGDTLTPYTSIRQYYPQSESYTRDVNYVEVAFSPQNEINDDINSSFGYFNIGEYIGDPGYMSSSATSYTSLDKLRDTYFEKYYKNYNWTDYIRLIKYFDNSLFKMIKDFVPAKSSLATGVVIKQHLLERNRQRPAQVDYSFQNEYSGSIKSQQYWDNVNEEVVMSSSLIESIEGANGSGKTPPLFTIDVLGAIKSTGSLVNGTILVDYNTIYGKSALHSGSDADYNESGSFEISGESGDISFNLAGLVTSSKSRIDIYEKSKIDIGYKFNLQLVNPVTIQMELSSSKKGIVSTGSFEYEAGSLPPNQYTTLETIFFDVEFEEDEIYNVFTTFDSGATNRFYPGSKSGLKSIIRIAPVNELRNNNPSQISPSMSFARKDGTNLQASYTESVDFNNGVIYKNISIPSEGYEIVAQTIAGEITSSIRDGRELYNGELKGTELTASKQVLSRTEYQGSAIEYAFTSSYRNISGKGAYGAIERIRFGGYDVGSIFIDTCTDQRFSLSPSGTDVVGGVFNPIRGQVGIGSLGSNFPTASGPVFLPAAMMGLYIPTTPNQGSEINTFDFNEFNSNTVEAFVLSEWQNYSIDGVEQGETSSINDLVALDNPGDVYTLQITKDFGGYSGDTEVKKVANIVLAAKPYKKTENIQSGLWVFPIANGVEVYNSLAGNLKSMVSHSIHKFGIGEFGNDNNTFIVTSSEPADDFYHPGQNIADIEVKLIKQKSLSPKVVLPTVGDVSENRSSDNLFLAEYGSGLRLPTNQSALENNTATPAQTPDSNYTITGIVNSKYKGSKVSSKGFNQI